MAVALGSGAPPVEAAEPASEELWLPPLVPSPADRVQRRLYENAGRFEAEVGAEYLSRGDFFLSPGIAAAVRWYPLEALGLELAASRFFSFLSPVASEIRSRTGYIPDAQPPAWLFRAGARFSLGYGKLLAFGQLLHFEPQALARLALLTGEPSVAPGFDVGAGMVVHLNPLLHLRFEVALFPHVERRTTWVPVMGVIPSITLGIGRRP